MWFNLLKLDLSSIQIQGDTKGKNINIDAEDKCRKKLINFQKRIMRMSRRNKGVSADAVEMSYMPENIACEFVEKVDEMFNSITSFSYPIETEIDEHGDLSDGAEYVLMYFSDDSSVKPVGKIVCVIAFGPAHISQPFGKGYFTRIIISSEDYLLMRAVKKHWEES
tara:strand:- start:456 stop:953 length:498 start_codon:yes stop_codon:yes gene_type:complete